MGLVVLHRGPHRQPQSRGADDLAEAAQFRIVGLRQHPVGRFARELGFSGDLGDASLGLSDVAQREHKHRLVAFLDRGFQIGRRIFRVRQTIDQPAFVGKDRGERAASAFSPSGLCSPGGIPWHV